MYTYVNSYVVLRVSAATNMLQLQLEYKTFLHCHNLRFNPLSRILNGRRLNYPYDINICSIVQMLKCTKANLKS